MGVEGGGGGSKGGVGCGERMKAQPCASTLKTEEAVDRRQNNGSVKAVSSRHCAATSVTYYAITVPTAVRGEEPQPTSASRVYVAKVVGGQQLR